MSYELLILRRAQKDLAKLPKADFERMRSGNYRAIYEVDDTKKCVTILHIGNRSDIYS